MSLTKKQLCLGSKQIREKIESGRIRCSVLNEERIQPTSFEPTLTDEVFVIDIDTGGIRPNPMESVYRTLLQLPARQRQKFNISNGFEIKKGFTYLFPLDERVTMVEGEHIMSSPKSSLGRLFLNSRLLADFNPCFDEINCEYKQDSELGLWLLVQPLTFNVIVYPGLSLNQLRIFQGRGSKLTPSELIEENKKNPLVFEKRENGRLEPVDPTITDGLQIHLDLSGKHTEGIIGLRARNNPTPINLKKKAEYEAEHFFEPILKGEGPMIAKKGEHYLFSSKEVLKIPSHLNAELRSHSHIGFTGPFHFAGFFDNGFHGDAVFEVRSDEIDNMRLVDGMPASILDFYRTEEPDKIYGESIGSHYSGQIGPRPSKYFKPFDFAFAAKNYKKLSRIVLVQDSKILMKYRKTAEGFEFLDRDQSSQLYRDIENGFFHSRYDCESDQIILQPIPYIIIFGPDNTIFTYVRASDIKVYGDVRLFGKHSLGVGGHICKTDGPEYIQNNIEREVFKEEIEIIGATSKPEPKFIGTMVHGAEPVDRVHFGLVFAMKTDGEVRPKESALVSGKMIKIDELLEDESKNQKYETWSKVLLEHLRKIKSSL